MGLIVFGVVLPWFVVGLWCWLGYQVLHQNGRLLLRLEVLEEQLTPPSLAPRSALTVEPVRPRVSGLPFGSAAPEFDLPDLSGARKTLAQFRGRRMLLVFFNPRCGFCVQMVPELAALPSDGMEGHPIPVIVSTGGAEENAKLAKTHGIRCPILLQEGGGEVASAYRANGTPIGYLIDEEGKIASEVAVGAQALLALAGAVRGPVVDTPPDHQGERDQRGNRSLSDSKLRRDGLPAGTPAPAFTLPALDGGQLSLEQFRGRRVLLVLSDTSCGPCNQIAPRLETFHRQAI